jgi:formyltetrahydrofolate deformylase
MGVVAAVAGFLLEQHCNIVDSAQFGDPCGGTFFMRVCFDAQQPLALSDLEGAFGPTAARFAMNAAFHDASAKTRVIVMASRLGHCLNDLLYRYRIGALPIEIAAIVSNHRDFYQLAAAHDVAFHHLPVTPDARPKQEARLLELFNEERCELLVLARYMQVLSPALCAQLPQRAINIHHSFLPSFQGAKPYSQAYDRVVKLIGLPAHYLTWTLAERPISAQDVARVDHACSVADYAAVGREIECMVLARAVKWHAEHRILLNGERTVVFR